MRALGMTLHLRGEKTNYHIKKGNIKKTHLHNFYKNWKIYNNILKLPQNMAASIKHSPRD